MPVELAIVSGSLRGQLRGFDQDQIIIGGQPDCDVQFDPVRDPQAAEMRLVLRRIVDGWNIQSLGGGAPLVNQQTLSGTVRLRTGDVVRLSAAGPDVRFSVVSHLSEVTPLSQAKSAAGSSVPASTAAGSSAAGSSVPASSAAGSSAGGGPGTQSFSENPWRRTGTIVGLLAIVLIAGVQMWRQNQRLRDVANKDQSAGQNPNGKGDSDENPRQKNRQGRGNDEDQGDTDNERSGDPRSSADAANATNSEDKTDKTKPKPGDAVTPEVVPKNVPGQAGRGAVVLLASATSDEDDRFKVFASACAVEYQDQQVLVTSGNMAMTMARFRQEQGRTFYALAIGSNNTWQAIEIQGIYVHRQYIDALDSSAEAYNLGLLNCNQALPQTCKLAGANTDQPLTAETPLGCWAILTEWKPIARDDLNLPPPAWMGVRGYRAALTSKDLPAAGADGARLLELSVLAQGRLEGCPIFNDRGQLVAVCTNLYGASKEPGPRSSVCAAAEVDAGAVASLWADDGLPIRWIGSRPLVEGQPQDSPEGERNGDEHGAEKSVDDSDEADESQR